MWQGEKTQSCPGLGSLLSQGCSRVYGNGGRKASQGLGQARGCAGGDVPPAGRLMWGAVLCTGP